MTTKEQIEAPTSHGHMIDDVGTCPVCHRENVPLTMGTGGRLLCANEFACFVAYRAAERGD